MKLFVVIFIAFALHLFSQMSILHHTKDLHAFTRTVRTTDEAFNQSINQSIDGVPTDKTTNQAINEPVNIVVLNNSEPWTGAVISERV